MIKTFQIFTQHLRGSSRLEFWILVIRICFGFRISCFEFIENRISKQFSLSQQVISLNDVTLMGRGYIMGRLNKAIVGQKYHFSP
jgi:hypothetical protein